MENAELKEIEVVSSLEDFGNFYYANVIVNLKEAKVVFNLSLII